MIGGLSVLTDLAVYVLLVQIGVGSHAAKATSYVSGMTVGYIGNKLWTFESSRRSADEPIAYAILYCLTLGVNVVVNAACLSAFDERLSPPASRGLAFLLATGLTTILNFLGMRFVTFRSGIAQRRSRVDGTPGVDRG
ncbi:GtrA family protein [Rubinisphaera margarita]|uniref:GtrA family protein n=1 Tax=Rubinisphaera margarita TaxID=2909586 RepID=UPI0028F3F25F|nr:GtrA family protein [Rubinisphaera margarita]MCG6154649.1 GtrA family protein [Rubinisphaera margarita]